MVQATPGVPARLADRYEIVESIGRGGMGEVYRARDLILQRDVAVKIVGGDGGDLQDWVREARAAADVGHPGVAHVYDGGVQDGHGYVVMELVQGRTLREVLRERGTLPPSEAVPLLAFLAEALEAAHGRGVVHCDVKPQNVIVTPSGTPKLIDFGIARAGTTRTADRTEMRGSAAYVAPEQVTGGKVDGRTDVYALGAVAYEALTGRPPFEGSNVAAVIAQRLHADPRPPRELNPELPAALEVVVLRAMARDPAQRYQSAGELGRALSTSLDGDATVPLAAAAAAGAGAVGWGAAAPLAGAALAGAGAVAAGQRAAGAAAQTTSAGWPAQRSRRRILPLVLAILAGLVLVAVVVALGRVGGAGVAPTVSPQSTAGVNAPTGTVETPRATATRVPTATPPPTATAVPPTVQPTAVPPTAVAPTPVPPAPPAIQQPPPKAGGGGGKDKNDDRGNKDEKGRKND